MASSVAGRLLDTDAGHFLDTFAVLERAPTGTDLFAVRWDMIGCRHFRERNESGCVEATRLRCTQNTEVVMVPACTQAATTACATQTANSPSEVPWTAVWRTTALFDS